MYIILSCEKIVKEINSLHTSYSSWLKVYITSWNCSISLQTHNGPSFGNVYNLNSFHGLKSTPLLNCDLLDAFTAGYKKTLKVPSGLHFDKQEPYLAIKFPCEKWWKNQNLFVGSELKHLLV